MLVALTSGQKTGLAVMAAVFVIFALVASMLIPRFRPDFPGRGLRYFLVVAALLTIGMMTAVITLAKESEEEGAGGTEPVTHVSTEGTTTEEQGTGNPAAGKGVFAKAGCGSCHTLKAANATGTIGPNLDEAKPPHALVVERVTNGKGVMPPFKGQLSAQEIEDVAAYVVASTGG